MEVALVHDWLNQLGGAEAVLENLVQLFPRAPIYTSIYWRDGMPPAAMAFVTTHTSAVGATVIWVIIEWLHRGKPTMFGAATGSIAGLATITPASGFVGPMSALIIGLAAGAICYVALNMKKKFGYADSLDAFGVHGVGGIAGTFATGLFAQTLINPAGANGLFFGNQQLLISQMIAISITAIYSFGVTTIILKVLDKTIGLRIDEEFRSKRPRHITARRKWIFFLICLFFTTGGEKQIEIEKLKIILLSEIKRR